MSTASPAILSNFFEKQWTQNHPQYLSGLSRALYPTTFLEIAVQEFISIAIFGQVTHRGEYTIVIAVVNIYRNDNLPFYKMKPPALSNSWSDTFSFVREITGGPSVIWEFVWEIESLKLRWNKLSKSDKRYHIVTWSRCLCFYEVSARFEYFHIIWPDSIILFHCQLRWCKSGAQVNM